MINKLLILTQINFMINDFSNPYTYIRCKKFKTLRKKLKNNEKKKKTVYLIQ